MTKAILEKTCKVIVIEARTDTRGTMREAIKSLGFKDTAVATSIKEALALVEENPQIPKWIVTSLLPEDPQNALHLLVLFLRNPNFHHCRVSLVLEDAQKFCLPSAFELGLLSWHAMPFTQTSLTNEFNNLLTQLAEDPTVGCWTACNYLRTYLSSVDNYSALIKLEEKLMNFFPQNADFILCLAEAQQLAGKTEECLRTLKKAQYLGSKNAKGAKQLKDLISDEDRSKMDNQMSFAEAFGLKTAVLVDTDSLMLTAVKGILKSIGFQEIEIFEDGEAAWDWLEKNEEPHLMIQEWRLPKVSGPSLLQRCRQKGITTMPIVVLSSLVKGSDQNLLRELGVALAVEKPLNEESFIASLMTMLQQEKYPTSVKTLERKIHLELSVQHLEEARALNQQLSLLPEVPPSSQKAIDAAFAYYTKDYSAARTLAFEAFQLSGDSLIILNLIGKIFLKVGAYEESIKCFNKAQELSSHNLERLCLLAEAQTEIGDAAAAHASIEKATAVDAESKLVKMTDAKVNISFGNTQKASQILSTLEDLSGIVSYTNNRAVSLAKVGKLKESQLMYEKAQASLPETENHYRAIVLYNLGLSHVRANELEAAKNALSKAAAVVGASPLAAKIQSLNTRAEMAHANGTLVQLKGPPDDVTQGVMEEHKKDLMSLGFNLKVGEMCAHQLFKYPDIDDKTAQLLSSISEFCV